MVSSLCNKHNISKFIHVSALGIEKATNSVYAQSKLRGEDIIRKILRMQSF